MAGTAPHRELIQPVRFAIADETQDADIRRLLRENPMRGAVSVTFEREPDYFRSAGLAGGEDQTIVAYEDGRLVCMGRCTRRDCWVNGQVTHTGYLAELRLHNDARRRFAIVRDGYRFFAERQKDDLLFTSIAADNERARRLLESGARGLPAYDFLGGLTTLLAAVPRRPRPTKLRVAQANTEDMPALVSLLNQHGQCHQLATVWTEENLHALVGRGLPLDRFLIAVDGGVMVACGALWDQRSFRQTVIHDYAGALGVARPLLNVGRRLLGRPRLPAPGTALRQAFLSPLAFGEGTEALLPDFLEAFFPTAVTLGIEWITLVLPAGDARLTPLRRRFFTRTWSSRLYHVRRPDQPAFESAPLPPRFLPEVSLL